MGRLVRRVALRTALGLVRASRKDVSAFACDTLWGIALSFVTQTRLDSAMSLYCSDVKSINVAPDLPRRLWQDSIHGHWCEHV